MNEQWQRVLWKRQPYPDNYVAPFFLDGLRRNRACPAETAPREDVALTAVFPSSQLPPIQLRTRRASILQHHTTRIHHLHLYLRVRAAAQRLARPPSSGRRGRLLLRRGVHRVGSRRVPQQARARREQ